MFRNRGTRLAALAAVGMALGLAGRADAQGTFGSQSRADAASRMLVLAVQQGISSLPPTAGQSFSYRLDPEIGTFVPDEGRLEPVSFRSTQVIQPGTFSIRAAMSAFHLEESFGPLLYAGEAQDPADDPDGRFDAFTEFGTSVDADVFLTNIAFNYGVVDRVEVSLNVPVVVVDADATQETLSFIDGAGNIRVAAYSTPEQVQNAKTISEADGGATLRSLRYADLPDAGFNDGSNVGLGRVSLGGKVLALSTQMFQVAFSTEVFLPSPNEDEFSGSESFAILPRLITRAAPLDILRLHADVGYDYDFDEEELTRLVWNAGASVVPHERVVLDLGVGGSLFDEPIRWTPTVATSPGDPTPDPMDPSRPTVPPLRITTSGDTELGDNFVDLLFGVKGKITDHLILSGAFNVPLNEDGLRPEVVATLSAELYF